MEKTTMKIRGDQGRYTARVAGPNVTVRELEIELAGGNETHDLWRAVGGPENGRRIAIPVSELSWLADGQWREYTYACVTVSLHRH